jgi:hypothetical protein
MSTGWLFAMGVLVTVIVAIGVGLPIYGAILDGHDQAERERDRVQPLPERVGRPQVGRTTENVLERVPLSAARKENNQ